MIAPEHVESAFSLGMDPFFQVLDPSLVDAHRIRVLRLARYRTRMAADATAIVDNESVGGVGSGSHRWNLTLGRVSGHERDALDGEVFRPQVQILSVPGVLCVGEGRKQVD